MRISHKSVLLTATKLDRSSLDLLMYCTVDFTYKKLDQTLIMFYTVLICFESSLVLEKNELASDDEKKKIDRAKDPTRHTRRLICMLRRCSNHEIMCTDLSL